MGEKTCQKAGSGRPRSAAAAADRNWLLVLGAVQLCLPRGQGIPRRRSPMNLQRRPPRKKAVALAQPRRGLPARASCPSQFSQ